MHTAEAIDIAEQFRQTYGQSPAIIARAPGRVEFIGNHTDYNGGAVLGVAINRFVWVATAPNSAGRLRFASDQATHMVDLPGDPGTRFTGPEVWANYPLGVWRSFLDFNLPQPAGFDLLVTSDLPAGAGLSSSAALELATALAVHGLSNAAAIEPGQLAALGRHAENKYVGVPCGILDQGTCAFGRAGHLVHIDCRGPAFSRVPFPSSAHLWIFHTREKHALIDGLYAERHRECEEAAVSLGVRLLADLTPAQLLVAEGKLSSTHARRARHVVAEQARVQEAVAALQQDNLAAVGRLLTASHRSSQNFFENSTAALDRLVDLLESHPAVFGARLTGGGFGGAVLALTRDSFTAGDAAEIGRLQAEHQHRLPEVIHLHSADCAQVIWRG